ncbi:hypothetical protein [Xanthomarina sp.]|uniref:hypothetical protein n=1 Tax=Xanthomarina sp. TaxID=1931211 RepID=UPI002D1FA357|nr:hypothetical protein [Xanthomarina sp.]
MNGYLILSIVALMFLVIYWYSYRTVTLEDKKRKDFWDKKRHLEMAFHARLKERSERRRLKFERFMERSKEIQQELSKLQNSNQIQTN